MLNKDNIVTNAWFRLGDQNQMYNANLTERQKVAGLLFDQVRKELATDTTFLFNAVTVTLTKNLKDREGEYFRYNLPADFISFVRCSDRAVRFEGEYVYSLEDNIEFTYCRDLPLSEYPDSLEKLFIVNLALKLAQTYQTLKDNAPMLLSERVEEINKIVTREGLPFTIER